MDDFLVRNNYITHIIKLDAILFFEKRGKLVAAHYQDREVIFYMTFIELSEKLDLQYFVKSHRSYIVNKRKISYIDKDEIVFLISDKRAYISRNLKKNFMDSLEGISEVERWKHCSSS